jgi:hypothetical protein
VTEAGVACGNAGPGRASFEEMRYEDSCKAGVFVTWIAERFYGASVASAGALTHLGVSVCVHISSATVDEGAGGTVG